MLACILLYNLLWLGIARPAAAWNQGDPGGNFTIVNGQIFTPGLAIVDAPQPFTPLGGDFFQLALEISGDGQLPFPLRTDDDEPTAFHDINVFLTSSITGLNLTVSNGTNAAPPLGALLSQEPSSTVKHVNWAWPDCLVGDGSDDDDKNSNARGTYNVSIHQTFRLNGSEYYTIFALPISVTNEIPERMGNVGDVPHPGPLTTNGGRVSCNLLQNAFIGDRALESTREPVKQPYIGGPVRTGSDGSADLSDGKIGENSKGEGFIGENPNGATRFSGGQLMLTAAVVATMSVLSLV